MASKGQKYARYNETEQKEIVEQYKSGISGNYLAQQYGIPVGTIKTWKYKLDHPELITGNKRGRQKEKDLTKEDYKERYEILKKYRAFLKEQREKK